MGDLNSEVKERASNDKEGFYNKILSETEAAAYRNELRSVYASINKLLNVKPHTAPFKHQHGSILLSVYELIAEWQKHHECPDETVEKVEG